MAETNFIKDSENPVWNESFQFYTDIEPKIINFYLQDKDPLTT